MRKIVSWFLLLSLLCGVFSFAAIAKATASSEVAVETLINDGTVIQIDSVSGSPGDEVVVPVRIIGNPGFAGFNFEFSFDTNALEVMEITGGAMVSNAMTFLPNGNRVVLLHYDNISGDGILVNLKFKIKADAKNGEYAVAVSLTGGEGGFMNVMGQPISTTLESGSVTVKVGQLVESAVMKNGQVALTVGAAPAEDVLVVVTAYDGLKQVASTVKVQKLVNGENTFDCPADESADNVKVFLLEPGTMKPLWEVVTPQ